MENDIENNKIIEEFLNWEFDDLSETFETPFLKLVEPQAFDDEQFSCKLQWVIERLSEDDQYNDEESNNSEYIDTLLQCSKLLETLDDNGIKKIK